MNIWWIFRTEFRRLIRSRIGRAAIVVGMIIPLLYSSLYLYAFWDPYGHLKDFPIAVVNDDQGGVRDGQPVHYGADFLDQLRKDDTFKWEFVSAAAGQKGLEGDKYDLLVKIPPTFTQDVLSVTSDHPHRAEIQFVENQGKNYIASTISSRVETELREQLGNRFSQEYLKGIFDIIGDAGNGLSRAADGAGQLSDGAGQVRDGVKKAADGSKQVASGAKQVADGNAKLADGAQQFDQGTAAAQSGAAELQTGASQLADNSTKLATGLAQTTSGVAQVRDSLQTAATQTGTLATGLTQMQGVLGHLGPDGQLPQAQATDPSQLSVLQLLGLIGQKYNLTQDPAYLAALQKVGGVSGSLGQVSQQVSGSQAGLNQAVFALTTIAQNQNMMVTGAKALSGGSQQLATGAAKLNNGLIDLHKGSAALVTSSAQLASGSERVAAGSQQLANGTQKLLDGSGQVADGNRKLADQLKNATKNSQVSQPDQKAVLMSDPVHTVDVPIHPVSSYGMGLAPYFIPLSLWVGALMLYFILSMREYRWLLAPVSSTAIVLGKFFMLGFVGLCQTIISSLVLTKGLGLTPLHPVEFYLFNLLFSLTGIAIIGLLISRFGSGPGRFLAIVLLILQLTSSGGTFPLELVPHFFRIVSTYLPMNYGVQGLRAILATGDQAVLAHDSLVLGSVLIVMLVINILTTRRTLKVGDLHSKDQLAA